MSSFRQRSTGKESEYLECLDLGLLQIKSGDPQGSLDPLTRAYSLAAQVDNQEQKATALHLMALAYRKLSKPEEVLRNEQDALANSS